MRKAFRWIGLLLVAVTAVLGVPNAVDELGDGETLPQKSVGVAVTVYAIVSWIVLLGAWRRRRWALWAALAWTASTTYAAGMSTYVYGDGPLVAVLAAAGSCLLMGAWITWAVWDTLAAATPRAVASPESPV